MPPPRKSGLAKTLIKKRFYARDPRRRETNAEAAQHTTEVDDGVDWSKMGSVTAQGDLEDFLTTAELAGTEFAAERLNARIIHDEQQEADLKEKERKDRVASMAANAHRLTIPRRPPWTKETTAEELQQMEREGFLEWRRGLSALEEQNKLIITPYERNIEFWRQLWRVIERSEVLVQIVDARNPLLFLCPDIQTYVSEVDQNKRMILMLNKSDLLTDQMRLDWGRYFDERGIEFVFFSAMRENEAKEAAVKSSEGFSKVVPGLSDRTGTLSLSDDDGEDEKRHAEETEQPAEAEVVPEANTIESATTESPPQDSKPPLEVRCRLRSAAQLVEFMGSIASKVVTTSKTDEKCDEIVPPTVGMIGYPNVGKSSTINALCVEKKVVPVSATPGRTRHLQTIKLGDVTLCDCPGLVFPTFANTKAELVCNGILPIDQQGKTEYLDPVQHICDTVPRDVLNTVYGIKIIEPAYAEGDPNRAPTAFELLDSFGRARGYMSGSGDADGPRCARLLLKDYVKGKLLYCAPPPSKENAAAYIPQKKLAATERYNSDLLVTGPAHNRKYVSAVDVQFFSQDNVKALARNTKSYGISEQQVKSKSKRHNKKGKREKERRRQASGETAYSTKGFVVM